MEREIVSLSWYVVYCVFVKQKTTYEMRISSWSADVWSSDLQDQHDVEDGVETELDRRRQRIRVERIGQHDAVDQDRHIDQGEGPVHPGPFAVGPAQPQLHPEIGRASCRERVCKYV